MSSKPLTIVAVIQPKKGETEKVVGLLQDVANWVKTNEHGTLQYEIHRSFRPSKDGEEDIVMVEKYKDTSALKAHGSSKAFQEFQSKAGPLLRAPVALHTVVETGGFASRL